MKLLFNTLAASAAGLALSSSAAVLVQYDFASSLAPSNVDSDVTASDVGQFGLDGLSVTGGQLSIPASDITNPSDPKSNADYISFTVTPNNPLTLNLDSLTFDAGYFNRGAFSAQFSVFSSVDSYATSLTGNVDLTSTLSPYTVDLSGAAYQGLSAVTFRIAFGDLNNSPNNGVLLDNLTLNGTAVPEPHEYAALAGLGLLGFAVWRRTRRA